MAVKLKRKVSNEETETPTVKEGTGSKISDTEPVKKKSKVSTGQDLYTDLQGPKALDALKEWLYLISNKKDRVQVEKHDATSNGATEEKTDSSSKKPKTSSNAREEDITEDQSDDDVVDANEGEDVRKSDEVSPSAHIDSYLNSGGSLQQLINLLPSSDDAIVSQVHDVFKAMSKIILRISSTFQDRINEAVDVCRQLLQSYLRLINEMLNMQKSAAERMLNLELLTAMVTLDSRLAREILSSVSLESDTVEKLTSQSAPLRVRKAYINFLVALLIDSDPSLVMTVVNRPWLITSVMDGLQYDPCQTVVLLISTLQRSVVENSAITKTRKMTIFSTDGVLALLHLYKWKGPQNRTRPMSHWEMKKQANKPKPLADVNEEEVEIVAGAVHNLLLILLTHHRYGIIFRDASVAHHGERHNKLVASVLQRVGHPWEHTKVSDLVAKVLAACPDSMRSTMSSLEPFFVPRSSPKWANCVNFLEKVLLAQRPEEILQRQLENLTMTQLGGSAVELCAPPAIVRALCSNNGEALYNSDVVMAKHTIHLLVTMLHKIASFLDEVRRWATGKRLTYPQAAVCRRFITDFLIKNMPNLVVIGKAWEFWSEKISNESEAVEMDLDESIPSPLGLLSELLGLIELYQQLCPAALDPLHSTQADLKANLSDTVLCVGKTESGAQLRLRLYRLLLAIDDQSFTVENVTLQGAIVLLFQDLLSKSQPVRNLSWSVLQSLIKRAGSLEGSDQEAVVWLSAFQDTFSADERGASDMAGILAESMTRAVTHVAKYMDIIAHCEEEIAECTASREGSNVVMPTENVTLQELLDELAENQKNELSDVRRAPLSVASLSPWVPSFLEVLTEHDSEGKTRKKRSRKMLQQFTSRVLLRLLFRQPYPVLLLHLAINCKCALLTEQFQNYLQSWMSGSSPQPISSEIFEEDNLEVKLSTQLLMEDEESDGKEVEKLLLSLEVKMNELGTQDFVRMEMTHQIVLLSHLVVFHATQLAQSGELSVIRFTCCKEALMKLFSIAAHIDNAGMKSESRECVLLCLKLALSHPVMLQQFSPVAKHVTSCASYLTQLTVALVKTAGHQHSLSTVLSPYKQKLLTALNKALMKQQTPKEDPVTVTDAFMLSFEDISHLLSLLAAHITSNLLLKTKAGWKLSPWCQLTASLLLRAAKIRSNIKAEGSSKCILPQDVVAKVSSWIIDLSPNKLVDQSELFVALHAYLQSCPQHSAFLPKDLLPVLLNTPQLAKAGCEFAVWLFSRSDPHSWWDVLDKASKCEGGLLDHPALLLPLLQIASKQESSTSETLLQLVYKKLKSDVENAVSKISSQPSWLSSNLDIVITLVKHCMDASSRKKLCLSLKSKAPVLTLEREYYLSLVTCVLQGSPIQLLKLLLAWLSASLKRHTQTGGQATLVQRICENILKCLNAQKNVDWLPVKQSNVWQESIRMALKLGLRSYSVPDNGTDKKTEDGVVELDEKVPMDTDIDVSSLLLQVLSSLVQAMYSTEEHHEHVSMIYEMTVSHSEFLNAMMDNCPSKVELVRLLRVLAERDPKIMDSKQVPVFLAAYGATMTEVDHELLRLLLLYERSGVGLSHCRPYLWGREGASHYSIWSHTKNTNQTLWQQPRPDQVLNLLDIDAVQATIARFPLDRSLNVEEVSQCGGDEYDPAFYLPLFSHLLSPESPVLTHMFMRSGALALTLVSLSSNVVTVRAAAYTTLARFLSHLHMARGRDKDLLMQFISALRLGVSKFGEPNPRLASVVSVFLARAIMELANPLSSLYRPLMNYILAKPAINLQTVPEFMPLIHSDDVQYKSHRHWILSVIRDGVRSTRDVVLCMEAVVLKLLPTFYSCSVADANSKVLVLHVLRSVFKVQYGACCLVRDYCITSWLHQAIVNVSLEDSEVITEIVKTVAMLWTSLSQQIEGKKDAETGRTVPRVKDSANKVLLLLHALLSKLSGQTLSSTLSLYVDTLSDVYFSSSSKERAESFTQKDIMDLIKKCSNTMMSSAEIYDIMHLGCNFVDERTVAGKENSSKANVLNNSLRSLVIKWVQSNELE